MNLTNSHPNFQRAITAIAAVASMTPDAVYELWRQYSRDSDNSDQSALLSEFIEWYKTPLGGDRAALRDAAAIYYQ